MASPVIVLIGRPGAGKGTQAELLARSNGWVHLSSGQILRQHAPAPVLAEMRQGQLVEEPVVEQLLEQALEQAPKNRPWVLDGFVRLEQDEAWLEGCLAKLGRQLTGVILLDLTEAQSNARLALRGRSDDNTAAVAERHREYEGETLPVVERYRAAGILKTIDATGTPEQVAARVQEALA